MHRMIPFLALSLAACGLSSSKFDEQFEEKFCEELATCSDFTCDDATGTTTTFDTSTCTFDKAAAKDCLDGEWTCDDTIGIPIPPTACGTVYTECGGTTGTTGTGTTGTTGS